MLTLILINLVLFENYDWTLKYIVLGYYPVFWFLLALQNIESGKKTENEYVEVFCLYSEIYLALESFKALFFPKMLSCSNVAKLNYFRV